MKIKLIKRPSWVSVFTGVLLLTSCGKSPENLKVIPKDAGVVLTLDVVSLAQKGGLSSLTELKVMDKLKEDFEDDKDLYRIVEKITEDPFVTGVNVFSDAFFFTISEGEDEQFLCWTVELSDSKKFGDFVEDVCETEEGYKFHKELNYRYYHKVDRRKSRDYFRNYPYDGVAWDENKAIYIIPLNAESSDNLNWELKSLFSLPEERQVLSNNVFKEHYKNKKDISLWLSSDLIRKLPGYKDFRNEFEVDFRDNYICSYLSFEEDKVSLAVKPYFNEEIKELFEKNNYLEQDFSEIILKSIPENNLALMSLSIDPKKYYKFFKSQVDVNLFEKFKENFESVSNMKITDFVNSLNGNAVLIWRGGEVVKYTSTQYNWMTGELDEFQKEGFVPSFSLCFDLNDEEKFTKMLNKWGKHHGAEQREGYLEVNTGQNPPVSVFVSIKDTQGFITTDSNAINHYVKGKMLESNMINSAKADHIMNNAFYTYFNLDFSEYPEYLQNNMGFRANSDEQRLFEIWNKSVDKIEFEGGRNNKSEFRFLFNVKGENSLKTILNMIDDSIEMTKPPGKVI